MASITAKQAQLNIATTYLLSDLTRTHVAMLTHLRTMARRQEYRSTGLSLKSLKDLEEYNNKRQNLFNNLAMFGGMSLLAYSLYRAVRR
jgi:hypothetical protein